MARVAAAGALDALVFDTPCPQGQSVEAAFAAIQRERGRQFDPEVVAALLQSYRQVVPQVERFEGDGADASEVPC